jgi:hypothetical protein
MVVAAQNCAEDKCVKGCCAANAGKVLRIRIVFYQTKIWEEDQYTLRQHLYATEPAGDIQSIFNATREKSVSRSTVKRRLVERGLNGRVAVSKPLLRARNKRKRLLWSRKFKGYTKKDWENVLFTDESKFEISETSGAFMLDVERMRNL